MQTAQFRKNLEECFDLSELKTLCFDLGIKSEFLSGENIRDMTREIIAHCRRHNLGKELEEECKKSRPHVDWIWPDEIETTSSPALPARSNYFQRTKFEPGSQMVEQDSYIKFEWASEIKVDTERLAKANAINWIAIANRKTLENIKMKKAISTCLKSGGYIRLILLHPQSPNCQLLADYSQEYKNGNIVTSDIISTLSLISSHYKKMGKIDVRFVKYPPPYRIMLVDQNEGGLYMRLRWVVVSDAEDVPTVVASEGVDPQMLGFIKFMMDQFNKYWKLADVEDLDSLIQKHYKETL